VLFRSDLYDQREKQVGIDVARQMEIFVYLNTIDTLWVEHLDTMDDLRAGIGLRGYAQREPLIEYKKEGFDLFEKMMVSIDYEVVHRIYKVSVQGPLPQAPQVIEAVEKHPVIETGVNVEAKEIKEVEKGKPLSEVLESEGSSTKVTIERSGEVVSQQTLDSNTGQIRHNKIGRNDPCHCGSGKKYKKCHYPN